MLERPEHQYYTSGLERSDRIMIRQKRYKCDLRVLRVPVTWFLYFCQKIPTRDPCDMRDMCDMHDSRNYGTGYMKVWDFWTHVTNVTCILISEK